MVDCPNCSGYGSYNEAIGSSCVDPHYKRVACDGCRGTGRVERSWRVDGAISPCSECGGNGYRERIIEHLKYGKVRMERTQCPDCKGTKTQQGRCVTRYIDANGKERGVYCK